MQGYLYAGPQTVSLPKLESAPIDSPSTPHSVDLPLPGRILSSGRRRTRSNGGGWPVSLINDKNSGIVIPDNLVAARRFFARLPPPTPGTNPSLSMSTPQKVVKRCKGCHGFNDEAHASIPMGADRCTRDHDERCSGGIIGGPDSKGREWRACPDAFISNPSQSGQAISADVKAVSEPDKTDIIPGPPLSLKTSPTMSVLTTTVPGSQSFSLSTPTMTTSSSQQAPILSSIIQTELADEIAALDRIRAERKALEEQLALQAQQKLSAERLEIRRQLQAEQDRVQQIKSSTASHQSSLLGALGPLQSRGHDTAQDVNCPNYYTGPNIRDIRKLPGLQSAAEIVVDKVRENVPSLSRRPSAWVKKTGTRPKQSQHKQQMSKDERDFEDYKQFCSWKSKFSPALAESGSDSDASPPRAAASRKVSGSMLTTGLQPDPITDPSSSEEESPLPVVLV